MTLTSCVNDLPYDEQTGAPKLVLNAMLRPDGTPLSATVSRTAHFLDTREPQRLTDATVTATINGEHIALTYDAATQSYTSHYDPRPGDEVTLTATHTLGTATATQHVMHPIPVSIARAEMQPFTNPGDPVSLAMLNDVDSALLVSLHIDDPKEENNYYRLSVHYEGRYLVNFPDDSYGAPTNSPDRRRAPETAPAHLPNGTRSSETAPAYSSNERRGQWVSEETFYPHYRFTESSSRLLTGNESASQLLSALLYMSSTNSFIFTDEQLRNTEGEPIIDLLMLMETPNKRNDMNNEGENGWNGSADTDYIYPADTITQATYHYAFMVESLSEDYYLYLQSIASYEASEGVFVGEGVPIHTNINGGLGIVGSYSTTATSGATRYRY